MANWRDATANGWRGGGILVRLARDVRGNAAAMLAMMLVPLMLFVGSAVDVSRVYTVKARLQQACDAGVLAGKRAMTGSGAVLDDYAKNQARSFFRNNFHTNQPVDTTKPDAPFDLTQAGAAGWMQTVPAPDAATPGKYLPAFDPTKTSESQVAGTATIRVPMAIMKMFGFQPVTLIATCEARYDTADADIMFVLDVTGSMACLTSDTVSNCNNYAANNVVGTGNNLSVTEKANSRIDGLRAAVLSFFDTVTDPANAAPSTNFRFGFVPYNATANVGYLLKSLGYVKSSAGYQTRAYTNKEANSGSPTTTSTTSTTSANCPINAKTRSPAAALTWTYDAQGHPYATWTTNTSWSSGSGGTCNKSVQVVGPEYNYAYNANVDTSQYIGGTAVNNPATVQTDSVTWAGCVEERIDASSDNQTTFSYTSPPADLDPDPKPTGVTQYWAPWWPEVEYYRINNLSETSGDISRDYFSRAYYVSNQWYWVYDAARSYNEVACPYTAKRLTQTTLPANSTAAAKTTVRNSINTYLNALVPYGSTYHDVGMLWGLRLISPTGMFAGDTAAWGGHNAPNRFIVFLTDGDMESDPVGDGAVYSTNGMEKLDSRVANGATGSSLDTYHKARFTALCQMAKNRNIKIFTIAYAQTKTPELTSCASPGQDYYASDAAALQTAFSTIAKQVALLRISK